MNPLQPVFGTTPLTKIKSGQISFCKLPPFPTHFKVKEQSIHLRNVTIQPSHFLAGYERFYDLSLSTFQNINKPLSKLTNKLCVYINNFLEGTFSRPLNKNIYQKKSFKREIWWRDRFWSYFKLQWVKIIGHSSSPLGLWG